MMEADLLICVAAAAAVVVVVVGRPQVHITFLQDQIYQYKNDIVTTSKQSGYEVSKTEKFYL